MTKKDKELILALGRKLMEINERVAKLEQVCQTKIIGNGLEIGGSMEIGGSLEVAGGIFDDVLDDVEKKGGILKVAGSNQKKKKPKTSEEDEIMKRFIL